MDAVVTNWDAQRYWRLDGYYDRYEAMWEDVFVFVEWLGALCRDAADATLGLPPGDTGSCLVPLTSGGDDSVSEEVGACVLYVVGGLLDGAACAGRALVRVLLNFYRLVERSAVGTCYTLVARVVAAVLTALGHLNCASGTAPTQPGLANYCSVPHSAFRVLDYVQFEWGTRIHRDYNPTCNETCHANEFDRLLNVGVELAACVGVVVSDVFGPSADPYVCALTAALELVKQVLLFLINPFVNLDVWIFTPVAYDSRATEVEDAALALVECVRAAIAQGNGSFSVHALDVGDFLDDLADGFVAIAQAFIKILAGFGAVFRQVWEAIATGDAINTDACPVGDNTAHSVLCEVQRGIEQLLYAAAGLLQVIGAAVSLAFPGAGGMHDLGADLVTIATALQGVVAPLAGFLIELLAFVVDCLLGSVVFVLTLLSGDVNTVLLTRCLATILLILGELVALVWPGFQCTLDDLACLFSGAQLFPDQCSFGSSFCGPTNPICLLNEAVCYIEFELDFAQLFAHVPIVPTHTVCNYFYCNNPNLCVGLYHSHEDTAAHMDLYCDSTIAIRAAWGAVTPPNTIAGSPTPEQCAYNFKAPLGMCTNPATMCLLPACYSPALLALNLGCWSNLGPGERPFACVDYEIVYQTCLAEAEVCVRVVASLPPSDVAIYTMGAYQCCTINTSTVFPRSLISPCYHEAFAAGLPYVGGACFEFYDFIDPVTLYGGGGAQALVNSECELYWTAMVPEVAQATLRNTIASLIHLNTSCAPDLGSPYMGLYRSECCNVITGGAYNVAPVRCVVDDEIVPYYGDRDAPLAWYDGDASCYHYFKTHQAGCWSVPGSVPYAQCPAKRKRGLEIVPSNMTYAEAQTRLGAMRDAAAITAHEYKLVRDAARADAPLATSLLDYCRNAVVLVPGEGMLDRSVGANLCATLADAGINASAIRGRAQMSAMVVMVAQRTLVNAVRDALNHAFNDSGDDDASASMVDAVVSSQAHVLESAEDAAAAVQAAEDAGPGTGMWPNVARLRAPTGWLSRGLREAVARQTHPVTGLLPLAHFVHTFRTTSRNLAPLRLLTRAAAMGVAKHVAVTAARTARVAMRAAHPYSLAALARAALRPRTAAAARRRIRFSMVLGKCVRARAKRARALTRIDPRGAAARAAAAAAKRALDPFSDPPLHAWFARVTAAYDARVRRLLTPLSRAGNATGDASFVATTVPDDECYAQVSPWLCCDSQPLCLECSYVDRITASAQQSTELAAHYYANDYTARFERCNNEHVDTHNYMRYVAADGDNACPDSLCGVPECRRDRDCAQSLLAPDLVGRVAPRCDVARTGRCVYALVADGVTTCPDNDDDAPTLGGAPCYVLNATSNTSRVGHCNAPGDECALEDAAPAFAAHRRCDNCPDTYLTTQKRVPG